MNGAKQLPCQRTKKKKDHSSDKNKNVLEKHTKLWNEIKNQIKANGGEPIEHKKDFMKIRLESDDDLPLGKMLSFPSMIVVTRSVFPEDNKYSQVCLCEFRYEFVNVLQKCYNTKELMFQKELTLINQISQKNA